MAEPAPTPTAAELNQATETDVRVVSVIWRGDDEGGSIDVDVTNTSEFEAAGILRAALGYLEENARDTKITVRYDGVADEFEEDDE